MDVALWRAQLTVALRDLTEVLACYSPGITIREAGCLPYGGEAP